ncbi:MAG TPA: hypothetical protein RMG48_11970 [Myxococcales bacterium LLY-WYZ-16_1]|nr:hypothetical protein [Myxococcales bacterium LLY-WYZ-16_1]
MDADLVSIFGPQDATGQVGTWIAGRAATTEVGPSEGERARRRCSVRCTCFSLVAGRNRLFRGHFSPPEAPAALARSLQSSSS